VSLPQFDSALAREGIDVCGACILVISLLIINRSSKGPSPGSNILSFFYAMFPGLPSGAWFAYSMEPELDR
jgi:hypothetical protein